MLIHFFTKGDTNVASSRQRAHLLAFEFQRYQVDTVVHTPPVEVISQTPWPQKSRLLWQIARALTTVKKEDVLFLQRTIYNKYFFVLIILFQVFWRRKMIFDFDDAIYLHSPWKTKIMTKLADAVTVGNHELEAWAKTYNRRVYLIPTCTYFTVAPKKEYFSKVSGKKFIIGWVGGGPTHRDNLALLPPVFIELMRRTVRFKFVLAGSRNDQSVCDLFRAIPGLDVQFIDWVKPEDIPRLLQTFDVGVMPLLDTPWNRGKSALKAVEYMASGVVTLASPVGENNYLIQTGVDGFLPTSTKDWADVIEKLFIEPELISTIGKRGTAAIQQQYVYYAQIIRLLDIINA